MNNNSWAQLEVVEMSSDFFNHDEYEQYALVYSKTLKALEEAQLAGKSTIEDLPKDDIYSRLGTTERYVKICYKHKTIYRKCMAKAGYNSTEIGLGLRTRKELDIQIKGGTPCYVCVKPTSFLGYYLFNSNRYVAITSWATFVGILFTVLSSVVTFLSVFIELPFIKCGQ